MHFVTVVTMVNIIIIDHIHETIYSCADVIRTRRFHQDTKNNPMRRLWRHWWRTRPGVDLVLPTLTSLSLSLPRILFPPVQIWKSISFERRVNLLHFYSSTFCNKFYTCTDFTCNGVSFPVRCSLSLCLLIANGYKASYRPNLFIIVFDTLKWIQCFFFTYSFRELRNSVCFEWIHKSS